MQFIINAFGHFMKNCEAQQKCRTHPPSQKMTKEKKPTISGNNFWWPWATKHL